MQAHSMTPSVRNYDIHRLCCAILHFLGHSEPPGVPQVRSAADLQRHLVAGMGGGCHESSQKLSFLMQTIFLSVIATHTLWRPGLLSQGALSIPFSAGQNSEDSRCEQV